jgi:GT2 family glycosyltransferase
VRSLLRFPAPSAPKVSIVVPTFGRWEWTAATLGALLANTESCYELIVVDNGSPDDTVERLTGQTENVRLVQNSSNLGFGVACNQGASHARGEFLVFLNSDVLVAPGWLAPLVGRGASVRVGAAGPRFLDPDGTVQEAGPLLYRGGATSPHGRAEVDAQGSRRPRIVDYVSAACLLVRRRAFDDVGGFDAAFGAGYYEDVDLCLALARCGFLTVVEPRSTVTHVFGWSARAGRDHAALERNRGHLARTWHDVLEARPPRTGRARDLLAARDAPAEDRLLVVDMSPAGASTARGVAAHCPTAHVALLGSQPERGHELVEAGIEVLTLSDETEPNLEAWLTRRRFHYDVVVSPGRLPEGIEEAVRSSQPQAIWIDSAEPASLIGVGVAVDSEPGSTPISR